MSTTWNVESLVGAYLGSCLLERPLGVGGMGAVYLARQERPHRQVAVKVLRPEAAGGPHGESMFLARFRREADATASLDHGNIVPIYEFGEHDGIAYLVMPYLSAGSLADLLKRNGPLSVERALAYVAQIGAALDYAHAQGIIHRDVKPSNVLLHPDGRLLLADFGIARPLDRADPADALEYDDGEADNSTLTRGGAILGTPQYMAPEQITGDPVGPATDLYALGVLAYTLLAGHPPFDGGTGELLRRQVGERPPSLRPLRPDVSPRMEAALFRALAKRPEERPRSAGAFAASLRDAAVAGQTRTGRSALSSLSLNDAPARGSRSGTLRPFALRPPESAFVRATTAGPARPSSTRQNDEADDDEHDAPTIYDGVFVESYPRGGTDAGGGPPLWPGLDTLGGGPPENPQRGGQRRLLMMAGGALIALVLLAALIAAPGLFSHSADLGHASASATSAATATATATTTPTPSPTPIGNWLRLSTNSVNLTCSSDSRQAKVTLTNRGLKSVSWAAQDSGPGFFANGISVKPTQGSLRSGQSTTITLTDDSNNILANGSGTLIFRASNPDAGSPATLDYTSQGC